MIAREASRNPVSQEQSPPHNEIDAVAYQVALLRVCSRLNPQRWTSRSGVENWRKRSGRHSISRPLRYSEISKSTKMMQLRRRGCSRNWRRSVAKSVGSRAQRVSEMCHGVHPTNFSFNFVRLFLFLDSPYSSNRDELQPNLERSSMSNSFRFVPL